MVKRISRGALLLAALLTLVPIVLLLWQSLQVYENGVHTGVGAAQYADIFRNRRYWQNYGNSLILTAGSLLPALPVGVLGGAAIAMNRKWQKGAIILCFLALMMPFQVTMLPLFQMAVQSRVYDTHFAIMLLNTFAPLGILVCWALIRQIDGEQWDAALLETGSLRVVILRIILPQIMPGLLALALLLWSEAWNMVEQPLILLPSPEKQPLSIYYNDILRAPSGYAGAVLYALPVLMICALWSVCAACRKGRRKCGG